MIKRVDGWTNVLTGLGLASRDKRMSSAPVPKLLQRQELEDLFRADDVARKVVARVPKEMFREGYDVKVEDKPEAGQAILQYLRRLNADEAFRKAITLARLHGGAGVILGIEDGQEPSEPVNTKAIRSIEWLAVLDRWQLIAHEIQQDLSKPDYGLPMRYQISANSDQNSTYVHASRVIRFDGIELPENSFVANNYWGDSVLSAMYNPLSNFNTAHDSAANVMADFAQAVFKLKNLSDLIASGDDDLLMKRLQLLDATRSVVRALVIQDDEEFTRQTTNLTGLPEILKAISERLVAASDMPHTILLGEGSQGNTSGRSEQEDFYNLISHEQQTYLKPKQMKLIEYITLAKDGVPVDMDKVTIKYWPLWSLDEQEAASTYKTQAEADAIYISNGVLDPDEVAKARFGGEDSEIQLNTNIREVTEFGSEPVSAGAIDAPIQETALNGAQVTSLVEVITSVAAGALPRESGLAIIQAAFAMTKEKAESVMGTVGAGFEPKVTIAPEPVPTLDSVFFLRDLVHAKHGDATEVQSLIMSKENFRDRSAVAAWVTAHGFKVETNPGIDETAESWRVRQREPEEFVEGSLKTIELREGIKAVIGTLKG
jgi:hypothetical protein